MSSKKVFEVLKREESTKLKQGQIHIPIEDIGEDVEQRMIEDGGLVTGSGAKKPETSFSCPECGCKFGFKFNIPGKE